MMDDRRFDALWERARAEKYAEDLAGEYPAWRTQTRRTAGMVAGLALVLAVATPLMLPSHMPANYEKVYCNHKNINDRQWVNLADELLMEA